MRSQRLASSLVVCLLVILGSCSSENDQGSAKKGVSPPGPATPPLNDDDAVAEPEPGTELLDGRYMAKIITINEKEATVDFVGWFTGDAAQREATNRGEQAPGGFFLANEHSSEDVLMLADNVAVTSVWAGFDRSGEIKAVDIDLGTLIEYFKSPNDIATNIVSDPFSIIVENGKVIRLDEQYIA